MSAQSPVAATAPRAVPAYGLAEPRVQDAREALGRIFRDDAAELWERLLLSAGLTGAEGDRASLERVLAAMNAVGDPVVALSARALAVRLAAYDHLSAAQTTNRRAQS